MGAPKRHRSTKDEEKLTAKLRKTGKHGVPAKNLHEEVELQLDEHSAGEEAELVANTNTKLTLYDSLLENLGTQNISVADALRRRQREEQGESDEDEDDEEDEDEEEEDSDPEPIDELEENAAAADEEDDDADDGDDSVSPRSDIAGKDKDHMEPSEDAGEDDYDVISDSDEEAMSVANNQTLSDAS